MCNMKMGIIEESGRLNPQPYPSTPDPRSIFPLSLMAKLEGWSDEELERQRKKWEQERKN